MELMNLFRFLHNLFTALWIGGLLSMSLVIIPGVRRNKQITAPWSVIDKIQSRLKPIAITSMVGLGITGVLLGRATEEFTGLMQFGTPYMTAVSVKHISILVMIVLAIIRLNVNRKIRKEGNPTLQKVSIALVYANSALGIFVLFLSSII